MLDEHVAVFIFENQAQGLCYMSFLLFRELILRYFMTILSFLHGWVARDFLGVTWDDFIQYSMVLDEHLVVFIYENQAQGLWYMSFLVFREQILGHFMTILSFLRGWVARDCLCMAWVDFIQYSMMFD